jgi:hypothetical protein
MRNQEVWGYQPMRIMETLFQARPIAGKHKVYVKGLLRRYPDRIELCGYIPLKSGEYLAVRTTYKGKLYGPYRVPEYSEFKGERGSLENMGKVDLPVELVTAIKSRFAEYIEWRIRRYTHEKNPDIKKLTETMKSKPIGHQVTIDDYGLAIQ